MLRLPFEKKAGKPDFFEQRNEKYAIFAAQISSGCSAVRLARQLRELEVAGSNPVSPTMCREDIRLGTRLFIFN